MDYKWTQSEKFQERKIIYLFGRMLSDREWRQQNILSLVILLTLCSSQTH